MHLMDVRVLRLTLTLTWVVIGTRFCEAYSRIILVGPLLNAICSNIVISLYRDNVNNGLVVGDVRAPQRLVIMNTSDMHFDPCLPR